MCIFEVVKYSWKWNEWNRHPDQFYCRDYSGVSRLLLLNLKKNNVHILDQVEASYTIIIIHNICMYMEVCIYICSYHSLYCTLMTYQRGQNIVCLHVRRIMENATRWRRQEKACNFYNQLESHSLFSTLSSFTLPFLKSWPLLYQAARLVENKP